MNSNEIISLLPYSKPFLFVDEILSVNENEITGTYTYHNDLTFYKGHFKNYPVTPGVILTETMAQIGVVCFGINMMNNTSQNVDNVQIALTSTVVDFFKPVFPGEKVTVISKKEYFRFQKLKCKIEMYNEANELVSRGSIAGMMKINEEE